MVNTVLSWIANIVFCILLIIQPRYFSNHLSKKNLRRLTTEYRAKVKAKSGLKKEKAKKAFLWKLINTVNDTEPQVWLWICSQILWICKKKTSVPVIELLPLSSKFTFHFPSVKTDLGLLNILPLSQAQSIEGAVETGGKDWCLVPVGLLPTPLCREEAFLSLSLPWYLHHRDSATAPPVTGFPSTWLQKHMHSPQRLTAVG